LIFDSASPANLHLKSSVSQIEPYSRIEIPCEGFTTASLLQSYQTGLHHVRWFLEPEWEKHLTPSSPSVVFTMAPLHTMGVLCATTQQADEDVFVSKRSQNDSQERSVPQRERPMVES
jgi:hypothetical protein